MLMRSAAGLLLLALAACGTADSGVPVQAPDAVVATFNDVVTGCSHPLVDAASIDQAALAQSGWAVTSRTARFETTTTTHALTDYPDLRSGEYEATQWQHSGHAGFIELIRGANVDTQSFDSCNMNGRVADDAGLAAVVAGMARRFGRAPDRTGAIPRGGDFLTPRSDPQQTGYYWAMPQHDVYVDTSPDGYARIRVVAMPDRSALDQYAPDRPENRLYRPSGEPTK